MRLHTANSKSKDSAACAEQCRRFWDFLSEWLRIGTLHDEGQPYSTSPGVAHVVAAVGARPFVTQTSSMHKLLLEAMAGASREAQLLVCYVTGVGVSFDRMREFIEAHGQLDWEQVPVFLDYAQGRKLWKVGRRSPGLPALCKALNEPGLRNSLNALALDPQGAEQQLWDQLHCLPLVGAYRAVTMVKSLRTLGLVPPLQSVVLGSGAKAGLRLLKPCKLGDLLCSKPETGPLSAADALDIEFWLCYFQSFTKHSDV
jgi:hypothetical protein